LDWGSVRRWDMEEHFSEPEPNVIESSTGFTVSVLGLTGMRYVEGDRSVRIDSEVLARPGAIAMFKDRMKGWEPPNDSAEITEADRERITSNIKRAFDACEYDLEVQPDRDWSGYWDRKDP
jgi:Immunity protein 74